ncbi:glycosyltransferase [uncultured Sphingomonas sp.]|uniref:glycosyltransferase family 4 protein n=1 Tax=uncultured Sphingomonas sp. TaxID=158754 RepID=UPI0025EF2EA9|nr:glycosyltransferase [uncultured Sphingomonas sp.]
MKLLFLQSGNYAEAWTRLRDGGPEDYRDQRASVDVVSALAEQHDVLIVSTMGGPYQTELAPGLRAIGLAEGEVWRSDVVEKLAEAERPDLIFCRTVHRGLLGWARRHDVPTLASFADLFANDSLRALYRNARLGLLLRGRNFPCVANHSLNASRSLSQALLYPKNRIVPWDWSRLPVDPQPRTSVTDPANPVLMFAGMLIETKGVGDCLQAVALLRDQGRRVTLRLAGKGDIDGWKARAAGLGIADRVEFLGLIPHDEVRRRMRESDMVVVPSHHAYAEGLPNVIYEALATRTPLILSDHPSFAGRLREGEQCLTFPEGDGAALAGLISRVTDDAKLFATLSLAGAAAHEQLYVGMKLTALMTTFIGDPRNETGWVARNSLAALR